MSEKVPLSVENKSVMIVNCLCDTGLCMCLTNVLFELIGLFLYERGSECVVSKKNALSKLNNCSSTTGTCAILCLSCNRINLSSYYELYIIKLNSSALNQTVE